MAQQEPELLTVEEAAKRLNLPVSTVYELCCYRREIPGAIRLGRHWRINWSITGEWVAKRSASGTLSPS